jgi:hypothetical protein
MRFLLGGLILLFNVLDNATTYLCLRAPAENFEVFEANPVARWVFEQVGLAEGLALEMLITAAAVCFLTLTPRIPSPVKLALLGLLAVLPAWAAMNNLHVMQAIGIGIPYL